MGIFDDSPALKWLVIGAVGSAFIAVSYDVFETFAMYELSSWQEPLKSVYSKFVGFAVSLCVGMVFFLCIKLFKKNNKKKD